MSTGGDIPEGFEIPDAASFAARVRATVATALAANLALVIGVALALGALEGAISEAQERRVALERARAEILWLDELLTMSARMAASTG